MQNRKLVQNAGHPLGKTADRVKIEQKLRYWQSLIEHQSNQVDISDAISGKRQQQIHHIGPEIGFLSLFQKRTIQREGAVPEIIQPAAKPKDADILCKGSVFRLKPDIIHLLIVFDFFLPVAISPLVDALVDKITGHRCRQNHKDQSQI